MNETKQEREMSEKLNCDDFLRGQRDCLRGVYREDQSESYTRGWSAQYELEQVQDALTGGEDGYIKTQRTAAH